MKILVYGAGVIGSQICHALCKSGNDVSVIARGSWADLLEKEGLRIHHYIQRKDTIDHPHILRAVDEEKYDLVFAVMQYKQMEAILEDLAKVHSPMVVLVGNNLSASTMEEKLRFMCTDEKAILFGFGSTAGTREKGKLNTVHIGDGKLTIGKIDQEPSAAEKAVIKQAFKGSRMSIEWCDAMDAWLKYHVAAILPVVYLCYKTGCDLSKATKADREQMLDAMKDAYDVLMALGYPVRPKGDEKTLEKGLMNTAFKLVMYLACKSRLGALCTTEHCKHAPKEMEDLDKAFRELIRKKPDFPMSSFDRLYQSMPSWEEIRRISEE